jgi:hypothetical protein
MFALLWRGFSSTGFTSSQRRFFVDMRMTMFYKEHHLDGTIHADGIAHNVKAGLPPT